MADGDKKFLNGVNGQKDEVSVGLTARWSDELVMVEGNAMNTDNTGPVRLTYLGEGLCLNSKSLSIDMMLMGCDTVSNIYTRP